MLTIWKFVLALDDCYQGIGMPKGAEIVHFAMQRNVPTIWALVDPAAATEFRQYLIAGTGQTIEGGRYIGTTFDGPFVWHLFEVRLEVA